MVRAGICLLVGILSTIALASNESGDQQSTASACRGVIAAISEKHRLASGFFLSRNQNLHNQAFVKEAAQLLMSRIGEQSERPHDQIALWLEVLRAAFAGSTADPDRLEPIKAMVYQDLIIKEVNIPEQYYQLKLAEVRNQQASSTQSVAVLRAKIASNLILEQIVSLNIWWNYLTSESTNQYPIWLKYWAFMGMARLAKFDPQTGKFGTRTKTTVAPFVELNPEALAFAMSELIKNLGGDSLTYAERPEFVSAVRSGNFGKLYAHALTRLGFTSAVAFSSNAGVWVKFPQGSDHKPLVDALSGHHTGWCTAAELKAKADLAGGDFHVFFPKTLRGNSLVHGWPLE